MTRYIWLKCSDDEYEWPVAIALSSSELEEKLHLSHGAVCQRMSRAKKKGFKTHYHKFEITEEEYNELR